jgi:hypothetical protein
MLFFRLCRCLKTTQRTFLVLKEKAQHIVLSHRSTTIYGVKAALLCRNELGWPRFCGPIPDGEIVRLAEKFFSNSEYLRVFSLPGALSVC